jgi:hypothetical protein
MLRLILLVVMVLTGCTTAQAITYSDQRDFLGNPYPVECLDESHVRPRIVILPEASLRLVSGITDDRFVYGFWDTEWANPDGVVYVASELDATLQLATLRHEFCHAVMYQTRGDPRWHR